MAAASLDGKRIVVIGGSSGIGFAIARAALDEGAQVMIGSSNPANVEAAARRLGDGAQGHAVDVRAEDSVAAFFGAVGAFDHLAYTAGDWGGFRTPKPMADLDLSDAGAVFAVRFWGAVAAVKHAVPHIAKDGSITLTDGLVAHRPRKAAALSTAMAGAVEHLTQGLAVDLAPVRVNCVCPGLIVTEVWNSIPEDQRRDQLMKMTERQPLARPGDPSETAQAYLYLMRGGYTTGQVLMVDGGRALV
jgi:NAD(P)-dependent dehydrogenase (short-subunit alcohol dehydrogenase family)